jgi:outer membrane protein OmpA-like peptidoglycan-associated protein
MLIFNFDFQTLEDTMNRFFKIAFAAVLLTSCAHEAKQPEPVPAPAPAPAPAPVPEVKAVVVVHFGFDSAKLTDKAQKKEIADVVKTMAPDTLIKVVGHTDSQGKAEYNQKLSLKRANSVVKYLTKTLKVDEKLITVEGLGSTKLLNADKTKAEHKANRRAEIIFVVK